MPSARWPARPTTPSSTVSALPPAPTGATSCGGATPPTSAARLRPARRARAAGPRRRRRRVLPRAGHRAPRRAPRMPTPRSTSPPAGTSMRWRQVPEAVEVASFDPRTPEEKAEYAAVRERLVDRLEEGLARPVPLVDTNLFGMSIDPRLSEADQADLARLIELGQPMVVFIAPPPSDYDPTALDSDGPAGAAATEPGRPATRGRWPGPVLQGRHRRPRRPCRGHEGARRRRRRRLVRPRVLPTCRSRPRSSAGTSTTARLISPSRPANASPHGAATPRVRSTSSCCSTSSSTSRTTRRSSPTTCCRCWPAMRRAVVSVPAHPSCTRTTTGCSSTTAATAPRPSALLGRHLGSWPAGRCSRRAGAARVTVAMERAGRRPRPRRRRWDRRRGADRRGHRVLDADAAIGRWLGAGARPAGCRACRRGRGRR